MSDERMNEVADAAAVEAPADRKTLKEAVEEGLEQKGSGKDLWLW